MGLVVLAADKAFDLCRFAALPVVVVVAVSLIHATSAAEGVQIGPLADHEELIGPGGAGALEGLTLVGDRVDILLPCRSEEHTSELQSLMRISYAVFCLKKKKNYIQSSDYLVLRLPTTNKHKF